MPLCKKTERVTRNRVGTNSDRKKEGMEKKRKGGEKNFRYDIIIRNKQAPALTSTHCVKLISIFGDGRGNA